MRKRMVDLKVQDGKIASIDGYELGAGSGGSGGIAITNSEQKNKTGSLAQLSTSTYDGYDILKPNTSYNIGDCFTFTFSSNFEPETLQDNQIIVPTCANIEPEHFVSSLTIGEVVLALTGWSAGPQYMTSDNKTYTIRSYNYVYFTVVKAGTTGASIPALPRAPKISIEYVIYTLGQSTAK